MRLIRMAQEIGAGKGINVRRPDAQELLAIRRGEVDLDNLIDIAEQEIVRMDEIFKNSTLPEKVNPYLVSRLLIKIRTEFYKSDKKSKLSYHSISEILSLFSNGFEKYNIDPIFRQTIDSLYHGSDSSDIIEQLIGIVNNQKEEMLKLLITDKTNGID
jgi:hypothetical protein